MSNANEKVSLREFGRFIGVSDTAVRKKMYDPEKNPTGPLKASLCKNQNNDRPMLFKYIALAEWQAAGLTINNPEIKTGANLLEVKDAPGQKEPGQDAKAEPSEPGQDPKPKDTKTTELNDLKTLPGKDQPPGQPQGRTLSEAGNIVTDDMDVYEAKKYKAIFEAGKLELDYRQKLGELVEKKEVYKTLFEFGQEIRNQLSQIPARAIPHIMACDSEREAKIYLLKEIEDVILNLLAGPKEPTTNDNSEGDSDKPVPETGTD